jgi:hypothetical protein
LNSEEAEKRLKKYGENELKEEEKKEPLRIRHRQLNRIRFRVRNQEEKMEDLSRGESRRRSCKAGNCVSPNSIE